jgi:signal transduction histidine kinase
MQAAADPAKGTGERTSGFERLITHLATHFINVPSQEIDGAVTTALQKLVEFARLHRASIVLLDETRTIFAKSYEWNAEGVRPGTEVVIGMPVAHFGWVHEQMFAGKLMVIGDTDDFPIDAEHERVEYARHAVGSMLAVPMMARGGPVGCLSFMVEDLKTWTHEDINLLEIAAEMFVNVFERKRTEELAERYAKELERSNEDLVEFAHHASHDLQEPLRMVAGYCELIEQRCGGGSAAAVPDIADLLRGAISGTHRMQELIGGLLAYSRIGSKRGAPHSTDCQTLLEVTVENLDASIRARNAVVTWDRLPTVVADTMQLGQVFQNLISNALKFCRDVPRVHVGCEETASEHVFSVRDNGIGMDPARKDRIFEAFVRLHSVAEYPGTGIGLSICKKIVERHGGRIWVESAPGEGSTFYLTIPRREIAALDVAAAPPAPPAHGRAASAAAANGSAANGAPPGAGAANGGPANGGAASAVAGGAGSSDASTPSPASIPSAARSRRARGV